MRDSKRLAAAPTRRDFLARSLAAGLAAGVGRRMPSFGLLPAGGRGGGVQARVEGSAFSLGNEAISVQWDARPDGLSLLSIEDRRNHRRLKDPRGAFARGADAGSQGMIPPRFPGPVALFCGAREEKPTIMPLSKRLAAEFRGTLGLFGEGRSA